MQAAPPGTLAREASPRPRARVAVGTGSELGPALTCALAESGLADALDAASAGRDRAQARVVIKAVLPPGTEREPIPLTYCDPELVELLAAALREAGFTTVAIAVPGPDGSATARSVGYQTQVLDLGDRVEKFHYGGLIGEHQAAAAWLCADARILVGKARCDRQLLYAGAMIGALGCVPASKELARRLVSAHDVAMCTADVLEKIPIAFGVIDAWCASDREVSATGTGAAQATHAVLASADLLALDWVLGELMDLDGPDLNPVVKEALNRRGPIDIERLGDVTEWDTWRNPTPLRAALADIGAGRWWGRLAGAREVPWTAR